MKKEHAPLLRPVTMEMILGYDEVVRQKRKLVFKWLLKLLLILGIQEAVEFCDTQIADYKEKMKKALELAQK
jgi:hypothetical protein